MDPNPVNLTVFRFVILLVFFLLSFAGIFIALGKLLNKQKSNCTRIKTINSALWQRGQPLLQSVATCKEEREEFKKGNKEDREEFKKVCDEILEKLDRMDVKQDKINNERGKQIENIRLHMQKIDTWYDETHKA